ncbi:hypothetical protein BDP81DRAFT_126637 [Colletotrichum phormii]|uniref:Uncharacterized protein n=1 Tax=Colletotrichum phormii TaxID=359342 RepID=A0AAI9ZZE8_9PEZI|nr:uncharacterized protein BDP81DRAFT_126637 [Colletotrichum phormii]KAK1641052.1 hypothetical protein BDP81DRAFT_126637 [Colletotrichum phormii]
MRASACPSAFFFPGHCGNKSAPIHEIFIKPFFFFFYHRTRPRILVRIRHFDFVMVYDARFECLTSYTKPPQIDKLTNDKKDRSKLGDDSISAPWDVEEVRSPRAEGVVDWETHPWISDLGRRWKLKPHTHQITTPLRVALLSLIFRSDQMWCSYHRGEDPARPRDYLFSRRKEQKEKKKNKAFLGVEMGELA